MSSTVSSSTPRRVESSSPVSATALRTHRCGELTRAQVGHHVRLGGWVHRARDLGGLVFIDLRDRGGLVQVSFDPSTTSAELAGRAAALGAETVVLVEGVVAERPLAMRNPEIRTG